MIVLYINTSDVKGGGLNFLRDELHLSPSLSLVKNIDMDSIGEYCRSNKVFIFPN